MRRSPQRKGAARGAGAAWGLACVLLLPVHCAAYCKLSDASVCWGNTYRFREVAGGPFDGINVGDDSAPVLADIDDDGDLAHPLAIATGICLIVLMIGSICVFRRRRPEAFAKATRAAEKTLRALATDAGSEDVDVIDGGSAQTAALSGAQDGLDNYGDACEAATGALPEEDAEEDEEKANFMRSVQTKLKILLAVIQIQNALPWTLPFVSYPEPFEALVAWMSFIELDFVRIVAAPGAWDSAPSFGLPPRRRLGVRRWRTLRCFGNRGRSLASRRSRLLRPLSRCTGNPPTLSKCWASQKPGRVPAQ